MTISNNAFSTYAAKGNREDLSDMIYNIAPTETPFLMRAPRDKATNTLFEWQTDDLATASTTNQQLEGDEITSYDASTATVRLGNYCQISRKTTNVTGTQDAMNPAGRKKETAYQVAKRGKELKRDMESMLLNNIAANAGSTSVARNTGSILAFIKTNVDKASNGVNPVYTTLPNDVRTNGTQRAWTETILKSVMQQCYESGANVGTIMVGSFNKQVSSGFAGIATKFKNVDGTKQAVITGAADVYVSDFGVLEIVPDRFQRGRDALFIDWEYVSVSYLRPFENIPLAKTGDSTKTLVQAEYGLRVKNEKALGLAADLTTS